MSFHDLRERVAAISGLMRAAEKAMRLPDERESIARAVRLDTYSAQSHTAVGDAFKKVRDTFAAQERRHGEIARDRELKRIAVEMNKLRADLPDLAIAARFELMPSPDHLSTPLAQAEGRDHG